MSNFISTATIITIIFKVHHTLSLDTSIPYRERIACLKMLDILRNVITSLEPTPDGQTLPRNHSPSE